MRDEHMLLLLILFTICPIGHSLGEYSWSSAWLLFDSRAGMCWYYSSSNSRIISSTENKWDQSHLIREEARFETLTSDMRVLLRLCAILLAISPGTLSLGSENSVSYPAKVREVYVYVISIWGFLIALQQWKIGQTTRRIFKSIYQADDDLL